MKNKHFFCFIFIITMVLMIQTFNTQAVEKHNNYVIQNGIISPKNLKSIMNNSDVKLIYIESNNERPSSFLPNSIIIPFDNLITLKNGIPYITNQTQIGNTLSQAGIRNDDIIIIYDDKNSPYVTRLFWTLKVFGHEYIKILNGGLSNWKNLGYKTVEYPISPQEAVYLPLDKNINMIATYENILDAIENENEIILDVRSPKEYNAGHIPSAINVPYYLALTENGLFKTYKDLQNVYHPEGVTPEQNMIYVYCEKGYRASFTWFVLQELLGYSNVKVYDGSYLEYNRLKSDTKNMNV